MSFTPEKAIILAAGQGKRLLPYTERHPKCLLPFEDTTLIEMQIRSLQRFQIHEITVVVGYKGGLVRERLGDAVRYVENDRYEETSSMYSLWLAREEARGGCMVLNSDVLFHPLVVGKLVACESGSALAMDFQASLNEEEMKVKVEGRRVKGLSKSFTVADGENVGMLKFDERGVEVLLSTIEHLLALGHLREMVPFAVHTMASRYFIEAVSVEGLPWIEIDFPGDYEKARREIYPVVKNAFI